MNFKRLTTCIVIVVLLYVGNLIYYQTQQIDGPFFLSHYYDVEFREDRNPTVELYYVTNKQHELGHIDIPGVDRAYVIYDHFYQQFPHFQIKKAVVEIQGQYVADALSIKEIDVQFFNEDLKKYSIGEMILRPPSDIGSEQTIAHLASGGSSDHTSFSAFEINEQMELVGYEYAFENKLSDELELFLDYENEELRDFKEKIQTKEYDEEFDYMQRNMWTISGLKMSEVPFPITVKKNDHIKVNSAFRFDEDSRNENKFYRFDVRLLFETEEGSKLVARNYMNYQPHFTSSEIKNLATKVGERDE